MGWPTRLASLAVLAAQPLLPQPHLAQPGQAGKLARLARLAKLAKLAGWSACLASLPAKLESQAKGTLRNPH